MLCAPDEYKLPGNKVDYGGWTEDEESSRRNELANELQLQRFGMV